MWQTDGHGALREQPQKGRSFEKAGGGNVGNSLARKPRGQFVGQARAFVADDEHRRSIAFGQRRLGFAGRRGKVETVGDREERPVHPSGFFERGGDFRADAHPNGALRQVTVQFRAFRCVSHMLD